MHDEATPRWARLAARLIPARYRSEVLGDLIEERQAMERAGRPAIVGAAWLLAHLLWSATASRRGARRQLPGGTSPGPSLAPWPGIGHELRLAARSLRRTPAYTLTVVAVTALSMALASTVFAVVDGVLFKPLPYPHPEELYAVSGRFDGEPPPDRGFALVSPREAAGWSAGAPNIALTTLYYTSVALRDGTILNAVGVDPGFFDVFGTRLLMGGFDDEHYRVEHPVMPIVISHRAWQEHFNGDPAVVGRTMLASDDYSPPMQVVGVLAERDFIPPLPGWSEVAARRANRVDVLRPAPIAASGELSTGRSEVAFARVPTERLAEADGALNRAAMAYRDAAPALPVDMSPASRRFRTPYDGVDLIPLRDYVSSRERPVFAMAFGMAVSLVLLVLLNVGALAAARAQQRIRDFSLRRALGARARDLARHALAEQALVFGAGAVVGLIIAPLFLALALDRLPAGLNLVKDVGIDWRVMAFAGLVSAGAAAIVTLLPVQVALRHASMIPAIGDLHGGSPARARIGRLLIAGQTAVAFALVLAGVLFAASLIRLWDEDPGLRVDQRATMDLFYRDYQDRGIRGIWAEAWELTQQLPGTPGLRRATLLDKSVMRNSEGEPTFFEPPASANPNAPAPAAVRVSGGFFDTAGVELVAGRLPSDAELDSGARIVAVSESAARAYWPGQTAIGRTLRASRTVPPVECTVVGVVRDVRLVALDVPSSGVVVASWALPVRQYRGPTLLVAVEPGRPDALEVIAGRLTELDPALRVSRAQWLDEAMAASVRERRFGALTASGFALVALVFVATGVLGLVAMTSSRRTREIAIRLALGAERGGVIRGLVGEQLAAVGAGLVAGGILAAWTAPLVGSRLYETGVYEPGIWALTTGVILTTAALGALLPAWRASRVDPAVTLKVE